MEASPHREGSDERDQGLEEILPQSPAQRRLWFLYTIDPGSTAYNLPYAFEITGPLDDERLERALAAVVERHEVLRTTFTEVEGEPVQVLSEPLAPPFERIDLSSVTEPERSRQTAQWLAVEGGTPFDLVAGPLVRSRLLRLAPERHLWILGFHHIVFDGASLPVLLDEIAAVYRAPEDRGAEELPELDIQYGDYALWQIDRLNGEETARGVEFWLRALDGYPAALPLPCDRPRPPRPAGTVASIQEELDAATCEALRALARQRGATPFMAFAVLWLALLSRVTGLDRVLAGIPVAGRDRVEVEGLIGFFVNTLVLAGDFRGDADFAAALDRLREFTVGALAHQDLPFDTLVERLAPDRHPGQHPLVQTLVSLDEPSPARELAPGLRLTQVDLTASAAKLDLTLSLVNRAGGGLRCKLEFAAELFERATAERLLEGFCLLARGAAADPGRPLSSLPLVAPAERARLLGPLAGRRTGYPREAGLDELFGRVVAGAPDAVALVEGNSCWSYRSLDRRAASFARRLRSLGAGRGTVVALALERSAIQVVAILGVLKVGAAYLPLDPGHPRERLRWMVENAGAAVLVGREGTDPLPGARLPRLALGAVPPEDGGGGAVSPAGGGELACVLYTSGSTGQPKGVAIAQRGVARLALGGGSLGGVGPGDAMLYLSAVSFDASTYELWSALLNGARLVVAAAGPPSYTALDRLIAGERLSHAFLTTALFNQWVDELGGPPACLRQLATGGEAASPEHFVRFRQNRSATRLVNGYGPTENSTFTTAYAGEAVAPVPLGRPIPDTEVFVVDARLHLVPAGVAGELVTGGDGLALGYWNRLRLTAERFVPHPFAAEPGARLYRTGDLVRWQDSGDLAFLGRTDRQIKLRGHRIEPAEIEGALRAQPGVSDALVQAAEVAGEPRLIAYLVATSPTPGDEELRSRLQERLPEVMVPRHFVRLDRFPLGASGKVDRRALPAPQADGRTEPVAPRSPLEEEVAGIWREVLGIERVGILDDFFALGGHSLLASRLAFRLGRAFGIELSARQIFDAPTVAELTLVLGERLLGEGAEEPAAEAIPGGVA